MFKMPFSMRRIATAFLTDRRTGAFLLEGVMKNMKQPWLNNYEHAKRRCISKKHTKYYRYGGRGIKFKLTKQEIKDLWFRDKAYLMGQPSIDRINNDGNYELTNCQFIEYIVNVKKFWGEKRLNKLCELTIFLQWLKGSASIDDFTFNKKHINHFLKWPKESIRSMLRYAISARIIKRQEISAGGRGRCTVFQLTKNFHL